MFRTVRHWWSGGQGRMTLRLFAFEFVVVVAGVLVAQALAGWGQRRGDEAEGRELIERTAVFAHDLNKVTNFWKVHGPCLRERVAAIARNAASGQGMTMAEIGRPGLPIPSKLDLGEADWRKIGLVADQDRIAAFGDFIEVRDVSQRYSADIADEWATFKLLDSSLGPPSGEDGARVRLAAAIIDSRMRWLIFGGDEMISRLKDAGIAPTNKLPGSERLVDQCGLLKDWR